MKITVKFFENEFWDAVGAGIYEVIVSKNGKSQLLYIGESVVVLARCATHLFSLKSDPSYFGFTEETKNDERIILSFKLVEFPQDKDREKKRDRREVEQEKIGAGTLTQSGISDWQKSKQDKISALNNFLNSCN